ncbi:helix-turn-helix transcriptional regulator [Synechococcus sp. MIT S9503]|uniref:helix-turn-helix transcriptional regulator n=1 Tax=Synechococcus sp. MIT S9503 TaxID=3082547 RepID=UPI0039A66107
MVVPLLAEEDTLIMTTMSSNPEYRSSTFPTQSSTALASDAAAPRFLRLSQVIEMTGVGKTFIYTHMEKGSFPKQIQISPRTVVWLEQDIIDWMQQKIRKS